MIQVETAFVLYKDGNGDWIATVNLEDAFELNHTATQQDIRLGCSEINRVIDQLELSSMVAQLVQQNSQAESQRISESMKEAVSRRKSAK